jgi:hypothetical protein
MPDIANDDVALVELMCVAERVGASPTRPELRQAAGILRDKGGKAAAEFLKHCTPGASISREIDNEERERDRRRDQ